MDRPVVVPGPRDVRGMLDGPTEASGCVVACPPHPQAGGTRSNPVLTTLGTVLGDRGYATLRFDYGPWDGGTGEVTDAVRTVEWAHERFDAVGLFGYSFGASVALIAASDLDLVGVSALAPAHQLPELDVLGGLERCPMPVQVLYGERDQVVDSAPLTDRARELGHVVEAIPGDHHFVGQREKVATLVADFFEARFDAVAPVT